MSKSAAATVAVTVTGDGLNPFTDSDTILNSTTAVAPTSAALVTGPNTIAVPSGVLGVKIKPPPSNAIGLTLKGVTGDTGVPIAPASPSYLALPSGTGSFVIAAGGSVTVLLVWC